VNCDMLQLCYVICDMCIISVLCMCKLVNEKCDM
jgi:hypothetical protein